MLEKRAYAHRGRGRIRLRRLHRQLLQHPAQACHPGEPARRRAAGEHALGVHHQSDAVVMVRDDLGKTRRQVGIQAETVQSPGAHTAEAAGVDGDQDVQMLVFAELPGDQRAGACRCLPVDPGQRVATHVAAQLVQLRARARDTPRARAARKSPRAHPGVQRIGSHHHSLLGVQDTAPPREPQRTQHARRQCRPHLWPEPHRQQRHAILHRGVRRRTHAAHLRQGLEARGQRRCVFDGERPGGGVGEHEGGCVRPPEKGARRGGEAHRDRQAAHAPSLEREPQQQQSRRDAPQIGKGRLARPDPGDRHDRGQQHQNVGSMGEMHGRALSAAPGSRTADPARRRGR